MRGGVENRGRVRRLHRRRYLGDVVGVVRGGRLAPLAVRGGVDGAWRLGGGAKVAQDGGEDLVDGARVLGEAQVDVGALGERVGVGTTSSFLALSQSVVQYSCCRSALSLTGSRVNRCRNGGAGAPSPSARSCISPRE